jgi:hypothetical protein
MIPKCSCAPPLLLRPALGGAEPGNHLVENQQDTTFLGDTAQLGDEIARHRDLTETGSGRFQDDRGDVVVALDDASRCLDVVGGRQQDIVGNLGQHAGRGRAVEMVADAECDMILPAMEMAEEADDLRLAGKRAREAERHQIGLGARRGEAHLLGAGNQFLHQRAPAYFQLVARSVMRAMVELRVRGFDDLGMVVAEQQRTVAAEIVDILVAVDIPFARSLRPVDIEAIRIETPGIVRQAAREDIAGLLRKAGRTRRLLAVGGNDTRIGEGAVGHLFGSSMHQAAGSAHDFSRGP